MSTTTPLQVDDLIFYNGTHNDINKILGDIRRSTLSVRNRLLSIQHDAEFVQSVAKAYGLPLLANERCGSWYIPPEHKVQSAYFKSTDGHTGQWAFSLRRLNLQVLETVAEFGGCVIVDSTRRGKSMPDALSKTAPIWIAVLNRFLFPEHPDSHTLRTPESVVTPSEHSQIDARIDGFVEQIRSLHLNLSALRTTLTKPLRALWVTQASHSQSDSPISLFSNAHPVILCTASRRVPGGEASEAGYIQGAADDSESWANGLTAPLFWANQEALLKSTEEELPLLITTLVERQSRQQSLSSCSLVQPTRQLFVGAGGAASAALAAMPGPTEAESHEYAVVVTCGPGAGPDANPEMDSSNATLTLRTTHLHLTCGAGKVGSRQLRHELPKLIPVMKSALQSASDSSPRTSDYSNTSSDPSTLKRLRFLVTCPTGKDLSIGIALAILCLFAADDGRLEPREEAQNNAMTKQFIKQRLSWLSVSIPDANPSRTTLQSVNAFLLG